MRPRSAARMMKVADAPGDTPAAMIRIEVTSYDGRPAAQPLAGDFDELGGTIGRAEGNTLVLPDPKRYISRTHAKVVFHGGSYMLRDESSATPVVLNGKPLGYGHEAPLGDGDVIVIAGYTMRVSSDRDARAPARNVASAAPAREDPLAAFGAATESAEPFGDLIAPAPSPAAPARREADVARRPSEPPRKAAPAAARASDPAAQEIPEDFDPFAEPGPEPAAKNAESADAIDFGVRDPKIDDIFGLSPADGGDPLKPGSPFEEASPASSGAPDLDPLVAIGAVPARRTPGAPAQRDDTPEIYGSIRLAPVTPEPLAASNTPRAVPPPPVAPPATQVPADAALLQAFLAGAGIPDFRVPGGLTPQLMTLLGRLFRESTQGTLDLLLARATAKKQLRSPMTTIVAKDNNPLKFSPSAEAAMAHLLAPQGRGFLEPAAALEDAFDDLRAHEFGFMAGMRAALQGALARFDPAVLERRLAQKSVLDALLPMNRQAKLWALFGELYAEISREAEDNFHSVFGAEFLKAYEEQIAKLDQEKRK